MLNLSNVLDASAAAHPAAEAVVCGPIRITYEALKAKSDKLASGLTAMGVGPGSIVAMACPNIPAFPEIYFAILKTGATVLPVSLLLKAPEITYLLEHSEAVAFLCFEGSEALPIGAEGKAAFDGVESCRHFAWIPAPGASAVPEGEATVETWKDAGQDRFEAVIRSGDDTAVVIYTSGTTGRPKGAELTHMNLISHALVICNSAKVSHEDTILVALPLFHVFAQICQMVAGIGAAARLVLLPRFTAPDCARLMREEGVNRFSGVPTMYWALLNDTTIPDEDVAAIRETLTFASSGGASLPVEILERFEERFGTPILEGYGLSETSPAVSNHSPSQVRKPGTCGTPLWGIQVQVVDEEDRPVPTGERGEIVVRGHCVMKGYLKDPEATKEAFRGGWFHTGDIGIFDTDGYLSIVDRKKEMIIRGGMNVYPREIEEVMITHPDISLVAVIGIPDERVGQEVKAFVVPAAGAAPEPAEIVSWCKDRMAAFKYPRSIEVRDALPMNATGKIQKRALIAES